MLSSSKTIGELADAIAGLSTHIDAATWQLLTLIREFDEREGWYEQGALSCAHWLSWRTGDELRTARDKVRVARALKALPTVDEALRLGKVSYAKVRALTRVATPAREAVLLELAEHATGAELERICRHLGQVDQCSAEPSEMRNARRSIHRHETDHGTVRIVAEVLPEEAEVLWKALDAALESRRAEPGSRVDGLVTVAETFLANTNEERSSPYQVVLHMTKDEVPTLDDGAPIPRDAARRLSCDARVVVVTESADGTPLDVGRSRRTLPARVRRAMMSRDKTCRFPGCTHRRWLHGHHIHHWADGGPTSLANSVTLCSHHHRLVHEEGFAIEVIGPGKFLFRDPRGKLIEHTPTPTPAAALVVDALPPAPPAGERVDYELCVEALVEVG